MVRCSQKTARRGEGKKKKKKEAKPPQNKLQQTYLRNKAIRDGPT
jgi:hypothetical protein